MQHFLGGMADEFYRCCTTKFHSFLPPYVCNIYTYTTATDVLPTVEESLFLGLEYEHVVQ